MEVKDILKKKGHWQDVIQYSPYQKVWRKDLHTGAVYLIDKWGSGIVNYVFDDIPRSAPKRDLAGLLDWKPVI